MALVVKWTPQAEKGLEYVINYLENNWSAKEIVQLGEKIELLIDKIAVYPKLYPKTSSRENIRKALVDKNNYIIYRIQEEKNLIEIINFRGAKQQSLES